MREKKQKGSSRSDQAETKKLIRRKPVQARGQLRVDEILDAAERLTRTTSWDNITTNHIAKEAGIPIGSLYQFFANKHAIAQALVERYIASIEKAFASLSADIEETTPAELVNAGFDSLLTATEKHTGLQNMILTIDEESETGKITTPIRDILLNNIEGVLAVRAPWMSAKERKLHAQVSYISNRAIFAHAISLKTNGNKSLAQQLTHQARVMQIAYYDHVLQEREKSGQ
jgi:AcrR family transcriptional regulator